MRLVCCTEPYGEIDLIKWDTHCLQSRERFDFFWFVFLKKPGRVFVFHGNDVKSNNLESSEPGLSAGDLRGPEKE